MGFLFSLLIPFLLRLFSFFLFSYYNILCIQVKAISDNYESKTIFLAESKQVSRLFICPVRTQTLHILFVLLICVLNDFSLPIELRKGIYLISFLILHPVWKPDSIFPRWIAELSPDPFINWFIKVLILFDQLSLVFQRGGSHLRHVPYQCIYFTIYFIYICMWVIILFFIYLVFFSYLLTLVPSFSNDLGLYVRCPKFTLHRLAMPSF